MRRFIAQSFAPYRYARQGGPVKTEDDPLDPAPPATARQTFAGMNHLDQAVTGAGGIALRYGGFYGDPDALIKAVCKRQYPIIGDGAGVMPFIYLQPPRRPCSRSTMTARLSTTSPTTSPPRHATGCRCSRTRSAPSRPATSPLARAAGHGRKPGHDDPVPRRLQRQGHERTRLDASLSKAQDS